MIEGQVVCHVQMSPEEWAAYVGLARRVREMQVKLVAESLWRNWRQARRRMGARRKFPNIVGDGK